MLGLHFHFKGGRRESLRAVCVKRGTFSVYACTRCQKTDAYSARLIKGHRYGKLRRSIDASVLSDSRFGWLDIFFVVYRFSRCRLSPDKSFYFFFDFIQNAFERVSTAVPLSINRVINCFGPIGGWSFTSVPIVRYTQRFSICTCFRPRDFQCRSHIICD